MAEHIQLLDLLQTVHSEIELAGLLHETARQFQMSHFAIYDVPAANASHLRPYIRLTNMPARFYEEYERSQRHKSGPKAAAQPPAAAPDRPAFAFAPLPEGTFAP